MNSNSPTSPSHHDPVTMTCPACGRPFVPAGRQRWCSDACRSLAYRRRKHAASPPAVLAAPTPRRPHTIYQCDACGTRALGQQRCDDCGAFTHRVGIGGCCPNCDEPIAIEEVVSPELATLK